MSKYKLYTYREFVKILKANGFSVKRQIGDHEIYKDSIGRTMAITKHINPMIARRLIKENGLIENKLIERGK